MGRILVYGKHTQKITKHKILNRKKSNKENKA